LLARSGVGTLRIIDRDYVEPSNLQRQSLFDENDARESVEDLALDYDVKREMIEEALRATPQAA